MNRVHKPVNLVWQGQSYTIEPSRIIPAIAIVEDYLTLDELARYAEKGRAPMGKLAGAYAALLNFAGARVTDTEVYGGMFSGADDAQGAAEAVHGLLRLMLPPDEFTSSAPGNASRPAGSKSSKRRTS